MKKVLLVSTEACDEVEQSLHSSDCEVITVRNGAAAVHRAKHTALDAAILVSAGRPMDRTETALNLRDVNPSIEIIFIASDRRHGREPPRSERVGGSIPNTRVLTIDELDRYMASPRWRGASEGR